VEGTEEEQAKSSQPLPNVEFRHVKAAKVLLLSLAVASLARSF